MKYPSDDIVKIVRGAGGKDEKLRIVCEQIKRRVHGCDWVGFYIVDELDRSMLLLGPFVGEATEHTRIPVGKGICGLAAERGQTIVVPDVSKETNYLSCSVSVKSEIVVPIFKEGEVVAELDIDSHTLNAFGDVERLFLESVGKIVAEIF